MKGSGVPCFVVGCLQGLEYRVFGLSFWIQGCWVPLVPFFVARSSASLQFSTETFKSNHKTISKQVANLQTWLSTGGNTANHTTKARATGKLCLFVCLFVCLLLVCSVVCQLFVCMFVCVCCVCVCVFARLVDCLALHFPKGPKDLIIMYLGYG